MGLHTAGPRMLSATHCLLMPITVKPMPSNFYAETSFTEMCRRGYFVIRRNTVRVRSCPTTGVRGR